MRGYVVGKVVDILARTNDGIVRAVGSCGRVTFTPLNRGLRDACTLIPAGPVDAQFVHGQLRDRQGNLGVWLHEGPYRVEFRFDTGSIPPFEIDITGQYTATNPLDLGCAAPYVPPYGVVVRTIPIPFGGEEGQVLGMGDFGSLQWFDMDEDGGLPPGGANGQLLSIVNGQPAWITAPPGNLPVGGTNGNMLAIVNGFPAWVPGVSAADVAQALQAATAADGKATSANNTANTALTKSNEATTVAGQAQIAASTAQTTAENAATAAAQASQAVSQVSGIASGAAATASQALQTAQTADGKATSANTAATTAQTAAATAQATAAEALQTVEDINWNTLDGKPAVVAAGATPVAARTAIGAASLDDAMTTTERAKLAGIAEEATRNLPATDADVAAGTDEVSYITPKQLKTQIDNNPGPQGPVGPQGPAGTGVTILGSFDSPSELPPTGNNGDAFLVQGDLYVWAGTDWDNVGNIKGPKGSPGDAGVGINRIDVSYVVSSASVTTAPTSGWVTTLPTVPKGQKLWTRMVSVLTNGNQTTAYTSAVQGEDGAPGQPGANGVGISTATTEYQLSASGTTAPTGTWSSTPLVQTSALPFLWARTTTRYTDSSETLSYSVSRRGEDAPEVGNATTTVAGLVTLANNTDVSSGTPGKVLTTDQISLLPVGKGNTETVYFDGAWPARPTTPDVAVLAMDRTGTAARPDWLTVKDAFLSSGAEALLGWDIFWGIVESANPLTVRNSANPAGTGVMPAVCPVVLFPGQPVLCFAGTAVNGAERVVYAISGDEVTPTQQTMMAPTTASPWWSDSKIQATENRGRIYLDGVAFRNNATPAFEAINDTFIGTLPTAFRPHPMYYRGSDTRASFSGLTILQGGNVVGTGQISVRKNGNVLLKTNAGGDYIQVSVNYASRSQTTVSPMAVQQAFAGTYFKEFMDGGQ